MGKLKKKRVGFVLDLAPLVDITFLLLTFFMFTAKFKSEAESEQKFALKRPKITADTTKIPERGVAMIKIGIDTTASPPDTSFYYTLSDEPARKAVFENSNLPEEDKSKVQVKVKPDALNVLVSQTRRFDRKIKFAVDADAGIQFVYIDTLMSIMRRNNATIFNFVTDAQR